MSLIDFSFNSSLKDTVITINEKSRILVRFQFLIKGYTVGFIEHGVSNVFQFLIKGYEMGI